MKATGRIRYLLSALALLVTAPSFSQIVIQAESATLQPQVHRDEVGYKACGVRAMVITQGELNYIDAYDFSLNLWANLHSGLLKAGKTRATKSEILSGKIPTGAVIPGPIKFWIAKENEGNAVMPQKIIPAEDKGFILAGADLVQTMEAIFAIIEGERMQFAARYKNQPIDVVVSFSAKMPEHELKPLLACLGGLAQRFGKPDEDHIEPLSHE